MIKREVNLEKFYRNLPESPGVYLMKDGRGRVLYVGKAANLKKRVMSYFSRPHDYKIEQLISQIKKIDHKKTDTTIEALILESKLIKKFKPPFNVKEKDDKSFLWVEITKEKFPRVLLVRGQKLKNQSYETKSRKIIFGPFTSASNIREALRIIRRIFPWSVHPSGKCSDPSTFTCESRRKKEKSIDYDKFAVLNRLGRRRPCFDYEIGLCPGTCVGAIDRRDYLKNIKNIKLFFEGKKKKIIQSLSKEMNQASQKLDFEKAEKIKRQIFALKHIQDIALVKDEEIRNWKLSARGGSAKGGEIGNSAQRIEGYDVSNISGTSATGSMVVFINGQPDKNEYRKFKIRTITKSDDVGMLKEVLRRRFNNPWPLPNLILIDGGRGQVNVAKSVLDEFGLKIPVLGIAKGPRRKKNEFIGQIPKGINSKTLIKIRNEAHRFAIGYHKTLRSKRFIS